MAYFDHIRRCNAHNLADHRPWRIGDATVGYLRHGFADRLAGVGAPLVMDRTGAQLLPELATPAMRSAALHAVCSDLAVKAELPMRRGEPFPVTPRWNKAPLAEIDRAWVGYFGLPAYGVHLNGYVRTANGDLLMWVARRARNKMTYPGLLDNMVAGGQPVGLSLRENMIKEATEEAGMPAALAARMRPVGQISYTMDMAEGLKLDTLTLFDLELPVDFVPANTDGEIEEFILLPLEEVARIVREGFEFKFNCALVVIDFLIRHGFLTPDDEPDYARLCQGLRAKLPL